MVVLVKNLNASFHLDKLDAQIAPPDLFCDPKVKKLNFPAYKNSFLGCQISRMAYSFTDFL
jgi:hypothetical protein